jgi:hypothetical protein
LSARLHAHDFGSATFVRWGDEAPWVSFLRGIILALEDSKRHAPRAPSFFAQHMAECEGHLHALGLTRAQAKALVFPEPEQLSRPLRRAYGIRLRRNVHAPASHTRAPRAPRQSEAAPASADASGSEPDPDLASAAPDARLGGWDALPPILQVEHLARLFGVSEATARRHLASGDYGPRFKSGRRWYLRTQDLSTHLGTIAEAPPPQVRDAVVRKWQARFDRARRRRQS